MASDALRVPPPQDFFDLDVPGVGVLRAAKPLPSGIPAMAAAVHPKSTPQVRRDQVAVFVADHLADGEVERVYEQMVDGAAPADALPLIARALSTWGTPRPYVAVINLAYLTAQHWRTIRLKLVLAGHTDPITLPTMHMALDVTEMVVLEALSGSKESEGQRAQFLTRLYAPTVEVRAVDGKKELVLPEGFADGGESSWGAFARAAAG